MSQPNPDRIYYNVVLGNDETSQSYTYANYKRNFTQSLINKPSDYYLSIVRFQIPTADIPLLIPEIESYPNTDVNKTVYTVTLNYQNFTSGPVHVMFETVVPNTTPRPITAQDPNPMKNPNDYYFIYTYRHFIRLVNNAYVTAYNLLNTAAGGVLTAGPPFITYDPTTLLMTFHCPAAYLNSAANPIEIYMNYKLFTFFDATEFTFYDYQSATGVRINVYNYNGTNLVSGVYLMTQQYQCLSVWNTFKSVQIVSNLLPINNEFIPAPSGQDQNTLNSKGVLKDFIPLYENGPEARTMLNFVLEGPYQLINLNSNYPINSLDISVYWEDRYGNTYLLSIPYNQLLTIKLVFIKRSTFTG